MALLIEVNRIACGIGEDIELAVYAMEIAPFIDHMVLFSGDGDFRPLVGSVQRRGVRVTVVSSISTQPPIAADELRRPAFSTHRRKTESRSPSSFATEPIERPFQAQPPAAYNRP
jgi:uncharacterized LabA/DUF88 family protein